MNRLSFAVFPGRSIDMFYRVPDHREYLIESNQDSDLDLPAFFSFLLPRWTDLIELR